MSVSETAEFPMRKSSLCKHYLRNIEQLRLIPTIWTINLFKESPFRKDTRNYLKVWNHIQLACLTQTLPQNIIDILNSLACLQNTIKYKLRKFVFQTFGKQMLKPPAAIFLLNAQINYLYSVFTSRDDTFFEIKGQFLAKLSCLKV